MKYINVVFLIFLFWVLTFSYGYSETYKAFSLSEAQKKILSAPQCIDYRSTYENVFTFDGITTVEALVIDRTAQDMIMIGREDRTRQSLTLDNFVTALRCRFVHQKWPLVSFEPTEGTEQTGVLRVRFEGGVKDTQFGMYLYNADYFFKKLILGRTTSNVPEVKSYWDLGMEKMKENPQNVQPMNSRLWFNPVLSHALATDDIIKPLTVQLVTGLDPHNMPAKSHNNTEGMSVSEGAAQEFVKRLRDNFSKLTMHNPSLRALESMAKLVAIAKALEEIGAQQSLIWWINSYEIKPVNTPQVVRVMTREEDYRFQKDGEIHRGQRRLSGGIQLKALVVKLKPHSMEALKTKVLKTRPASDSLSWKFKSD
jgi:hypothetical protein